MISVAGIRAQSQRSPTISRRRSNVARVWIVLLAALALGFARPTLAQAPDLDFPATDGKIHALELGGSTLYVGGSFNRIGRPTGGAVPIDAATGLSLPAFPRVYGTVRAIEPDGAGGWFIGGSFTSVSGEPRNNLAHIQSDLTLGSWNPNANGEVRALARSGSTLYVGGYFTTVGGAARNRIAALGTATGLASGWDPDADSYVLTLAVSGPIVYAGGDFATIGGQTRHYIAALDATSGLATSWNPDASFWVWCLLADGPTVYAGGNFVTIGGQPCSRLAALDSTTGLASTWNPLADNGVTALAKVGTMLYVGGGFTSIGGKSRNRLAEVNLQNGHVTNWNANADWAVYALRGDGATLYVAGQFGTVGGVERRGLAAVSLASGSLLPWDPGAAGNNSSAYALDVSGPVVFAGGDFTMLGAKARANIAAIDLTTHAVTDWNPSASDRVYALRASDSTVYAGGAFVNIGGRDINYLAALDATTGAASTWDAHADGVVGAIDAAGSTVYVGGGFANIGLQPRARIGAVDAMTALATAWNPQGSGDIARIRVQGSTAYVGGAFTSMGGQPRLNLAALDTSLGNATEWDPRPDGAVRAFEVSGPWIYTGGYFDTVGTNMLRRGVTALDAGTALPAAWDALTFSVNALDVHGPRVYVGGNFHGLGGQTRLRVGALDAATGAVTSWNPSLTFLGDPLGPIEVLALAASGSTVYVGGNFTHVGSHAVRGLAAIDDDALVDVPLPPDPAGGRSRLFAAPNPMRSRCRLRFELPQSARVSIGVFDLAGRRVRQVMDEALLPGGPHDVEIERRGLRSGLYFVRLDAAGPTAEAKLVVVD